MLLGGLLRPSGLGARFPLPRGYPPWVPPAAWWLGRGLVRLASLLLLPPFPGRGGVLAGAVPEVLPLLPVLPLGWLGPSHLVAALRVVSPLLLL